MVSQGAIRKLSLRRSDKSHLAPYANFLTTRFAGCTMEVCKKQDWYGDLPDTARLSLTVNGPRREMVRIRNLGDVAVSSHVLERGPAPAPGCRSGAPDQCGLDQAGACRLRPGLGGSHAAESQRTAQECQARALRGALFPEQGSQPDTGRDRTAVQGQDAGHDLPGDEGIRRIVNTT